MKKIIFILLLISFSTLRAEVEEKHPIIDDLYAKKYVLNLKEMSTDDLKVEKLKLTDILKNINAKFDKDKSEQEIFKTLMEYDEERIKIVFVLKDICKEYKVSKNIQDLLYRYSNTFEETIKNNRYLVKNLDDYKSYDFRIGANYLAMMTALQASEETKILYDRLLKDKDNPNTYFGKYNGSLRLAYSKVIKAKEQADSSSEAFEIKNILKQIESELNSR
ncbi:MAG: hypothetical protein VXY96_01805 [Pseudomonadota bacterium]|jgi:hypothetical protein|nr:hypothetical protein [Pseudomonadota bacterium]MEC9190320.1 hypothetical protein [Pseudomonadota bacterium]|tara:strand:- start:1060 stop:1719 length:660 start_codon:yes stop_codon:yes gene_type:complete